MKNLALTITAFLLILCSCTGIDDEPQIPDEIENAKVAYLRMDDVDDSKVLFLASDKSYMIFNGDAGNGRMTLYMNSSAENDIDKGIMIYMDSEGKPELIRKGGDYFLIDNLNESTFDMAHRKSAGGYEYHWDIPFVTWAASRSHSFFYYLWPGVTDFDWSWDEHMKKALWPFLLKMGSFTIDAFGAISDPTGASMAGVFVTLAEEMRKSGYQLSILDEIVVEGLTPIDILDKLGLNTDEFFKGKLKFSSKGLGLSMISSSLNRMGDEGLRKMSQMKNVAGPVFSGREWQLKLKPGTVTFDPSAGEIAVQVDTKAFWVVDAAGIGNKWCSARKDGDKLVVLVTENETKESRWCSVTVKTKTYSSEIPPAKLYVTQHGVLFDISSSVLTFSAEGGSKGVSVNMSENIKSWDITQVPDWVSVKKGKESFFVDVDATTEPRNSVLTVTGYAGDGIRIDRQLKIEQVYNFSWEGTSWNFTGMMDCTVMSETFSQKCDFGVTITDIAKNKFSFTGLLKGYEHLFKLKLNEDETLDMLYTEKQSYQGTSVTANASFLLNRIDMNNAEANLSGDIFMTDPEFGKMKARISGKMSGTRVDKK